MSRDIARFRILRFTDAADAPQEVTDELAGEEPLEIRIGGEPFSVTMRTPGHDLELVAGYLLAEGLVKERAVPLLRQEQPNLVNVAWTNTPVAPNRSTPVAASCGLCGKASIESIHQRFPPLTDTSRPVVSRRVISNLTEALESAQTGFAQTGGAHAAGLFDADGTFLVAREDVGRHNAVDKVIGHAVLKRFPPLDRHILLVSGRVSFEIVQKALGARIPVIAAVSAPSSLAVEFAESNGQTLIGFLRPGRCNVYSHADRVTC